jgi:hypothetical protein
VSGLPDGVVTFFFSDIEESTRLVKAVDEARRSLATAEELGTRTPGR